MIQETANRITKQHVFLMGYKPTLAYSGLLMMGKVEVTEAVETATTNGIDVKYNPGFVAGLTDPELRGLILHEAGHKAFQQLFVWQSLYEEDADLANKACDYVVNLGIKDLDPYELNIKLPKGGLFDSKYRGMDSRQVFDLLKEDAKQGRGNGGKPMDDHEWEAAKKLPEAEQQAVSKEIDAALRAGAFLAGKQGGDLSRDFEALLEPKVDWKEQLRDFVSSICAGKGDSTWAKPNRRWLGQDIYMPSQVSESIGSITVAIDTSGSISGDAISMALAELVGICGNTTPERVDLLYWDHQIAAHEVYFEDDYDKLLTSTKPVGGGGTSIECVLNYIEEFKLNPQVCIVITDLCFGMPMTVPGYPVLWVAVDNTYTTPPFGAVIRI
jgi:predicted metal-dependent peptidase